MSLSDLIKQQNSQAWSVFILETSAENLRVQTAVFFCSLSVHPLLAQGHCPNSAAIPEVFHQVLIISVSKDATSVFKATVKLMVEFQYGDSYSDFCALMFYLILINIS